MVNAADFAIQPTPATHKPGWQIVNVRTNDILATYRGQFEAACALRRLVGKPDPFEGWTFTLGARRDA